MMIRLRQSIRSEGGFTLIEMVAAMAVFALAAAAIASVLIAGISTAGFGRDRTIGKDLARQQLEEMRRLPFNLSHSTFARKADLLDFYYPDSGPGTGYDATDPNDPFYRVVIDQVPGFPRYRMQIDSRFLDHDLKPVPPAPGYKYNDPSNDRPPSKLLAVEVTTFWRTGNRQNTFEVRTQIGEARLEEVTVQASVTGNVVQVNTAFSDLSSLTAEAGKFSSDIYEGNLTTSRNESRAGQGRIQLDDGSVSELSGLSLLAVSPPDTGPLEDSSSSDQTLTHPLLGIPVMRIGPSRVKDVTAKVISLPPMSKGKITIRDSGDPGLVGFAVTNEVQNGYKFLNSSREYLRILKITGSTPVTADGSCDETLAIPQTVACRATGSTNLMQLVPADYSTLGIPPIPNNGYLISIQFSKLHVEAVAAQPLGGGSASAKAEFEGTVTYYTWDGDGRKWVAAPPITIRNGQANTLPDPGTICVVPGLLLCTVPLSDYIVSWTARSDGTTSITDSGRTVEASLPGVLTVVTTITNPNLPNSNFIATVGNLKAQAVDRR